MKCADGTGKHQCPPPPHLPAILPTQVPPRTGTLPSESSGKGWWGEGTGYLAKGKIVTHSLTAPKGRERRLEQTCGRNTGLIHPQAFIHSVNTWRARGGGRDPKGPKGSWEPFWAPVGAGEVGRSAGPWDRLSGGFLPRTPPQKGTFSSSLGQAAQADLGGWEFIHCGEAGRNNQAANLRKQGSVVCTGWRDHRDTSSAKQGKHSQAQNES